MDFIPDEYTALMLTAISERFSMSSEQVLTAALEAYCIKRGVKLKSKEHYENGVEHPWKTDQVRITDLIEKYGPLSKSEFYRHTLWLGKRREAIMRDLIAGDFVREEIVETGGRPKMVYSLTVQSEQL